MLFQRKSFILILFINTFTNSVCHEEGTTHQLKRRKPRSLLFHGSSAVGCIVAVAIPIDLPHRTTFLSFNFEANYLLPRNTSFYQFLDRFDINGNSQPLHVNGNNSFAPLNARSLDKTLSRTNFYSTFIGYMHSFGRNGLKCLLRAICEVSESSLGQHNGVFGNLIDILFLPSTSSSEHFPDEFYEAEHHGIQGDCSRYNNDCSFSFIEMISTIKKS